MSPPCIVSFVPLHIILSGQFDQVVLSVAARLQRNKSSEDVFFETEQKQDWMYFLPTDARMFYNNSAEPFVLPVF